MLGDSYQNREFTVAASKISKQIVLIDVQKINSGHKSSLGVPSSGEIVGKSSLCHIPQNL